MMPVFPSPVPVTAPVDDGRSFPVRRIFCVGQNYSDHTREMGGDPDRDPPFFFAKPADALVTGGAPCAYPSRTTDLHYEVELVAAIGRPGENIPFSETASHIWGYAVGIDLTRRDLQTSAKAARRPWDMAKGFDQSAPMGPITPAAAIGHPAAGRIRLLVNGTVRQNGDLGEMIWTIPEIVAELSTYIRLEAGDLIFTGTPAGVGPVMRGDLLRAEIKGLAPLETRIA